MHCPNNTFFDTLFTSENQQIHLPVLKEKNVELWIKREDLIHEFVSGNKFRKLKYNGKEAKKQGKSILLTFGGAYSNHIVATAVAGKMLGLKTIGVIRGDELKDNLNNVLQKNNSLRIAHQNGMMFEFITRADYRKKTTQAFIKTLQDTFGDFYLVPEGGTNSLAVKGCEEILTPNDKYFNYICTAVGTGGTIAGLINTAQKQQQVIGFPALKGNFLTSDIENIITGNKNWHLDNEYHFGGYAKYNQELIRFINNFKKQTSIPLDPIYTGKMMFGILDSIKRGKIRTNSKVVAIHTGGLQGIDGINKKQRSKNLVEIEI